MTWQITITHTYYLEGRHKIQKKYQKPHLRYFGNATGGLGLLGSHNKQKTCSALTTKADISAPIPQIYFFCGFSIDDRKNILPHCHRKTVFRIIRLHGKNVKSGVNSIMIFLLLGYLKDFFLNMFCMIFNNLLLILL